MNAPDNSESSRTAIVGFFLIFTANAFAQQAAAPGAAEVERVIVTGSNIPTAEETGPNPVDTYRPADLEKLGIRNAQDLETFLPQEAGGTVNLNIGNGGDGTVQINLRGLLPKETLILVDGKRVAFGSLGVAGSSQGQDINLIPFPMIDHIVILKLFFSASSPPQHSAPNAATSPFYIRPTSPVFNNGNGFLNGTIPGLDGNYVAFNFAAFTPALPPADRQAFYGSFVRDICEKYLTLFADFKLVRSFFDSSLAAVPFVPDAFKIPGTNVGFSPAGISVPISNPFNPFTVADATIPNFFPDGSGLPVTTGVRFRGINDTGERHEKLTYWDTLFDVGLKGEMGEFGDYFKTWNWETGFRYSRNKGQNLSIGEVSQIGLREALLDTNRATP